jgi:hypothetical protein
LRGIVDRAKGTDSNEGGRSTIGQNTGEISAEGTLKSNTFTGACFETGKIIQPSISL